MQTICMLSSSDYTRHVIIGRHISALLREGYQITIVDHHTNTQRDRPGVKRYEIRPGQLWKIRLLIWRTLHFFIEPFPKISEIYWTLSFVFRLILTNLFGFYFAYRKKFNVYIAQDLECILSVIVTGKLRHTPTLFIAHELYSEQGNPTSSVNRVLRFVESKFLKYIDQIIIPNYSRKRYLEERYTLKKSPVVILNCPPTKPWAKHNLIRSQLSLDDTVKIVLYHGNLTQGRALETLLQSMEFLDNHIVLVIIGEKNSYYYNNLEPIWQSLRLSGKVFFLPYIEHDQIMNYVASADLGVVIYKNINLNNYYCAPTKLYEYIMADIPVVACDFPELQIMFQQFQIGFLFDPDEPESIANAINQFFLLDMDQRNKIHQNLVLARKQFNWENEGSKLVTVIKELSTPA